MKRFLSSPVRWLIVIVLCLTGFGQDLAMDGSTLPSLLDAAEVQARKVADEHNKFLLLHNIALYRARVGQVTEAEELIKELSPQFASAHINADEIYIDIASQVAKTSGLEAAVEAAQQCSPARRDAAFYAVAEEFGREGKWDDASAALKRASGNNRHQIAKVTFKLASLAASKGNKAQVVAFLNRASELISPDLTGPKSLQTGTVELALNIAAQRHLCGDIDGAQREFSQIQSAISSVPSEERRQHYFYLLSVAAFETGGLPLAERTLKVVDEPMRRAQALAEIARTQIARQDFVAAESTTSLIPGLTERISVTLALADAHAKATPEAARRLLDGIAKLLSVASDEYKPWLTARQASVEYRLGNQQRATELWQSAIRLSERFTIHNDRERPSLIAYVARLQAEAGDEQGALATASLIGERGLSEVAYAQAFSGNTDSALKWIGEQDDPGVRASALLDIVLGAFEAQKPTQRQSRIKVAACQ